MQSSKLALAIGVLAVTGCPAPTAPRGVGISEAGSGAGDVVAFSVQPSNAIAREIITPAIQVTVRDTLGRPDSTFTGSVTVAIGTNPVGAVLSGRKTVAVVSGVASFGDLSIDRPGSGYTLEATAFGATAATSAAFDIIAERARSRGR